MKNEIKEAIDEYLEFDEPCNWYENDNIDYEKGLKHTYSETKIERTEETDKYIIDCIKDVE